VPLDVTAIAVRGRWVKHTILNRQPCQNGTPPPDNRWQRSEVVDALYLADGEDPPTLWLTEHSREG
jgi:hypothetical protein